MTSLDITGHRQKGFLSLTLILTKSVFGFFNFLTMLCILGEHKFETLLLTYFNQTDFLRTSLLSCGVQYSWYEALRATWHEEDTACR